MLPCTSHTRKKRFEFFSDFSSNCLWEANVPLLLSKIIKGHGKKDEPTRERAEVGTSGFPVRRGGYEIARARYKSSLRCAARSMQHLHCARFQANFVSLLAAHCWSNLSSCWNSIEGKHLSLWCACMCGGGGTGTFAGSRISSISG